MLSHEQALVYLDQILKVPGISPIPLSGATKRPVGRWRTGGWDHASGALPGADLSLLYRRAGTEAAGWWVACGPGGVMCLDIEARAGKRAQIQYRLTEALDALVETGVVTEKELARATRATPSGGRHVWIVIEDHGSEPEAWVRTKTLARSEDGEVEVEIRGFGGGAALIGPARPDLNGWHPVKMTRLQFEKMCETIEQGSALPLGPTGGDWRDGAREARGGGTGRTVGPARWTSVALDRLVTDGEIGWGDILPDDWTAVGGRRWRRPGSSAESSAEVIVGHDGLHRLVVYSSGVAWVSQTPAVLRPSTVIWRVMEVDPAWTGGGGGGTQKEQFRDAMRLIERALTDRQDPGPAAEVVRRWPEKALRSLREDLRRIERYGSPIGGLSLSWDGHGSLQQAGRNIRVWHEDGPVWVTHRLVGPGGTTSGYRVAVWDASEDGWTLMDVTEWDSLMSRMQSRGLMSTAPAQNGNALLWKYIRHHGRDVTTLRSAPGPGMWRLSDQNEVAVLLDEYGQVRWTDRPNKNGGGQVADPWLFAITEGGGPGNGVSLGDPDATAAETAAQVAWALTTRGMDEIGPAMAAVTNLAIWPLVEKTVGYSVRVVDLYGPSNVGKTTGLRPLLRLCGVTEEPHSHITEASLFRVGEKRRLPLAMDDPDPTVVTRLRALRGALTGGSRMVSRMDTADEVDDRSLECGLLLAAESESLPTDKAWSDRKAVLSWHVAAGNRPGADGKGFQWDTEFAPRGLTIHPYTAEPLVRVSGRFLSEVSDRIATVKQEEVGSGRGRRGTLGVLTTARAISSFLFDNGYETIAVELNEAVTSWARERISASMAEDRTGSRANVLLAIQALYAWEQKQSRDPTRPRVPYATGTVDGMKDALDRAWCDPTGTSPYEVGTWRIMAPMFVRLDLAAEDGTTRKALAIRTSGVVAALNSDEGRRSGAVDALNGRPLNITSAGQQLKQAAGPTQGKAGLAQERSASLKWDRLAVTWRVIWVDQDLAWVIGEE